MFSSHVPTHAKIDTCRYFDMTSHDEWNPDSVNIHDISKYLNYLKRTQGTFIRPNVILCTPTQSQHSTMSMIYIYITTLFLTKPYYRKFPPVYTIEGDLYCANQCYNDSKYKKWNTIRNRSPKLSL